MIRELLRSVFDRPILKYKIILKRRGWKFGALFYLGNVIWTWCGAAIMVLFLPIMLISEFCPTCGHPLETDNVVIKFLCNDWGFIDYVFEGLLFPMIIFWGLVNFALLFFGRGSFLK